LVLHKIKDIQNFNTLYTLNYTLYDQWNISKLHKIHLMKIHKYTNIFKVISLNYNPYNSCNHFSKSWGCKILCMYTWSFTPFTMNAPLRFRFLFVNLYIYLHPLNFLSSLKFFHSIYLYLSIAKLNFVYGLSSCLWIFISIFIF
jgi:hypothetical protein